MNYIKEDIMKRKQILILGIVVALSMNFSIPALAASNQQNNLQVSEQGEFETIIDEIQNIKAAHPEFTEDEILNVMNEIHAIKNRGIGDIWNSLTDSEKNYVFDIHLMH